MTQITANFKCEFPRRQAMLSVRERKVLRKDSDIGYYTEHVDECRVPVLVWPMQNEHGYFIVEHTDGRCEDVPAGDLTFLDSKELFDQYDWSEA